MGFRPGDMVPERRSATVLAASLGFLGMLCGASSWFAPTATTQVFAKWSERVVQMDTTAKWSEADAFAQAADPAGWKDHNRQSEALRAKFSQVTREFIPPPDPNVGKYPGSLCDSGTKLGASPSKIAMVLNTATCNFMAGKSANDGPRPISEKKGHLWRKVEEWNQVIDTAGCEKVLPKLRKALPTLMGYTQVPAC